ncbi:MAG: SBBP repeat-containing protein, partial [Bryobacteraceae bacterium]|nr:SBBP repeat-containing protein [Bryobacteraceae bacterium]
RTFVTKIDPAARQVVWEHYYTGLQLACSGGSSCFLSARLTTTTLAIDSIGNIYSAGNTNTLDLPTTPGAFRERGYGPYIRKLSPAGEIIWSTYLSDNRVGLGLRVSPADTLAAIAVGPDNSLFFSGGAGPGWPTSHGAYRTRYEGPAWSPTGPAGPRNAYVARISADGKALLYSTFLKPDSSAANSIAVDPGGNAFVSGASSELSFEPDYITSINAAGTAVLADKRYPAGSRGTIIALDTIGRVHAAGGNAGIVTLVDPGSTPNGLYGIFNAAEPAAVGRVARGELISILGASLGDEVYIDGAPVPVFYASDTQINTIIPFAINPFALGSEDRLTITVRRNGVETAKAVVALTLAQPEIFKSSGRQAAALNQDGSVNSRTNPAKLGSIVTVWGTGAAGWPRETKEGSLNASTELKYLPVGAIAGNTEMQSTFSGAAPGLAAGVFQVNVKLSEMYFGQDVNNVALYPVSGTETGSPAFVYVKP